MNPASIKISRSFLRLRQFLPNTLYFLLLLLILWQLAGLLWQIVTPWSVHSNLQMPAQWQGSRHVSDQALRSWFSNDENGAKDTSSEHDLTLTAVITGKEALAVFTRKSGGSLVVRLNQDITPGRRLVGVFERQVEVEEDGRREQILLPQRPTDLSGFKSVENRTATKLPPHTTSVKSDAIRIDRNALLTLMQQRNMADWSKGVSSYRDEGILIENVDQQPLAKALQLRNGDVIRQINHKKIKELQDVSQIYYEVSNSPTLTLAILRDGAQQVLSYRSQP